MIRTVLLATSLSFAAASAGDAAPCKDAKTGRFIKCPPAASAASVTGTRCKDSKGRFAKCGAPGAMPIAAKK